MAAIIQLRHDTTANWASANPILAEGEMGLDTTTGNVKIGDGASHWLSLSYKVFNIQGEQGETGTGLSRTTTSTIDFGSYDDTYVEKTITDALITTNSVIIIQPQGEDYALQEVTCGVVSISNGVSYTIYAKAPNGASGVMNINILIF